MSTSELKYKMFNKIIQLKARSSAKVPKYFIVVDFWKVLNQFSLNHLLIISN